MIKLLRFFQCFCVIQRLASRYMFKIISIIYFVIGVAISILYILALVNTLIIVKIYQVAFNNKWRTYFVSAYYAYESSSNK